MREAATRSRAGARRTTSAPARAMRGRCRGRAGDEGGLAGEVVGEAGGVDEGVGVCVWHGRLTVELGGESYAGQDRNVTRGECPWRTWLSGGFLRGIYSPNWRDDWHILL